MEKLVDLSNKIKSEKMIYLFLFLSAIAFLFLSVSYAQPEPCPTCEECGDLICDTVRGESCSTCPQDCGVCPPPAVCGNGICEAGESSSSCPSDCTLYWACPGPEKWECRDSDVNEQRLYSCSTTTVASCPYSVIATQTCSASNGWTNVGSPYACCSDPTTTATCQNQEFRSYSCFNQTDLFLNDTCVYSITGTQTVFTNPVACPPGNACSGGICIPTFDFSLSVSPASGSVLRGNSIQTTATATLTLGTSQPVTFSCSGLPAGTTCSFSPSSCTPTCSSTLTITTSASTPVGTNSITVSGTGGSLTRTATYTLTVNPPVTCALTSASITPVCSGGSSRDCETGESVTMSGTYTGDCSAADFFQIDASGDDCSLRYAGGDMPGINDSTITVSGGTVSGSWIIPTIASECSGETVTATAAALYDGGPPGTGTWLAGSSASGSFEFADVPECKISSVQIGYVGGCTTNCLAGDNVRVRFEYTKNLCPPTIFLQADASSSDGLCTLNLTGGDIKGLNITCTDSPCEQNWLVPAVPLECQGKAVNAGNAFAYEGSPQGTLLDSKDGSGSFSFGFPSGVGPPTISNVVVTPEFVLSGDSVNVSVDVTDSNGIASVKACNDITVNGCSAKFCDMTFVGGSTYRCTFSTTGLAAGNYTVYIFAADTLNYWSSTEPGMTGTSWNTNDEGIAPVTFTGPDPPGAEVFRVVTRAIELNVQLTDVNNLLVILTPTGEPNLTRGTPFNFIARAVIRDLIAGTQTECSDANCRAFHNIDVAGSWIELPWNDFEAGWVGNPSTTNLPCESWHTLYVMANKTTAPDSGLSGTVSQRFFITCTPRITITPVEKRVSVGVANEDAFLVTIWNPLDTSTFNLQMRTPLGTLDPPMPWVHFDCRGAIGCVPGDDDATLTVNGLGSASVYVVLDIAARVGSYPIRFTATTPSTPDTYEAFGSILIFAEGLAEFEAWQVGVLLLIAVVAYWFLTKPKKIPIRRKSGKK